MTNGGYDDLGPRIDLEADAAEEQEPTLRSEAPLRPSPPRRSSGGGKGGGGAMAWASLAVAVVALLVAVWALMSWPQAVPGPTPGPDVVPGGAAERVAKLEKDVSQMMLRVVTLEEELKQMRSKAGAVTKIAELSAQVAALKDRLDALGAGPSSRSQAPAPASRPEAKAQAEPAKPEPKAESEPKKMVYTVRRGDTLFDVARRYKVTISDLKNWNDLGRRGMIRVGQKLVIYK